MKRLSLVLALAASVSWLSAARGSEPTLAEEAAFRAAVARVAASVLRIEPLALTAAGGGAEAAAGRGPGTGLVVAPGLVLTTAFSVPDDVDSAVVVLPDGGRRAATVRARDGSRGLVLLAADGLPELPPLEPAPRGDLQPGQWSIAVGRAWDAASPSVAVGIVSAVDRAWGKGVQTDAAVSPMNYGGPLVDIAGRVIGILVPLPADTAGMTDGTELYDAGIGFAVPLEDVQAVLPRLAGAESLAPGILGIGYRSRDAINGEPVIASVRQGSPAAKAGLRPGDRILRIDDRAVRRIADARHAIAPRYAGDTITVTIERGDGDETTTVAAKATLVQKLPAWRKATIGLLLASRTGDSDDDDDDTSNTRASPTVAWVLPDGPADRAGLRAGDRLSRMAAGESGTVVPLDSVEAAAGALAGIEPGAAIALTFIRDGNDQTVTLVTAPFDGDVPDESPSPMLAADPLAGEVDAIEVVRLAGAEVVDPPLAVIPPGKGPVGVLVWCGPPAGRLADAEAVVWKAAAARHGVAVIVPGSADADAWSRGDIATVTRALASLHRRRPLDPGRIAIAGRGAGAAFAWLVAERLGTGIGGVAVVGAALPRQATIAPAAPGAARWILLGPGRDDATRQRVAADRERLEKSGHAVGLLPADAEGEPTAEPPADLLCRWATLLGLL